MSVLKLLADAFHEGGWPMWPILLLMITCIGISIERVIYLKKAGIDKEKLLALLKSQIMAGNVQGAIKVCSGNPTPMTRIIQAGLTKFNRPDHEVQAAMDEAALHELPKIEKRTGYLAMLGNVATLVGLLGTVLGLIHTFGAVAAQGLSQSEKQRILANGIAEAMYNTAFGLGIAVVCMVTHLVLHQRSKNIQHDLDATQERVFNLLTITARPGGY